MVLKLSVSVSLDCNTFESSVNLDGTKTPAHVARIAKRFESSVNLDGTKTSKI